jgi:hypothetical protein
MGALLTDIDSHLSANQFIRLVLEPEHSWKLNVITRDAEVLGKLVHAQYLHAGHVLDVDKAVSSFEKVVKLIQS